MIWMKIVIPIILWSKILLYMRIIPLYHTIAVLIFSLIKDINTGFDMQFRKSLTFFIVLEYARKFPVYEQVYLHCVNPHFRSWKLDQSWICSKPTACRWNVLIYQINAFAWYEHFWWRKSLGNDMRSPFLLKVVNESI